MVLEEGSGEGGVGDEGVDVVATDGGVGGADSVGAVGDGDDVGDGLELGGGNADDAVAEGGTNGAAVSVDQDPGQVGVDAAVEGGGQFGWGDRLA